MSQTGLINDPSGLWTELVDAEANASAVLNRFLKQPSEERLRCLREGLASGVAQRATAIRVIGLLPLHDRQALFPEIVRYASSAHGMIQKFRDLVVGLPHDWVVANIERVAEPLLESSSAEYQFEEYRRLLELYRQIGDRGLVERLARRAAAHPDEDIREAGIEFLGRLPV